jgi:hypothetical protein
MPKKTKNGKWKCTFCSKFYSREDEATHCERNHGIVYVAFFKSDLRKLVEYMYTKDEALLTDTLLNAIFSYKEQMVGTDSDVEDVLNV